ncbi:M67 family metallopeptidase [Methylomonas albis]|uniref:M67 family metallopeptidase n=1 Tax=Methylomonas albis TaxID=1854563 RepID=A0ABR9CVW8_9GAMM|nr:M67 family metallopeptidase [Methylomonas albis]MBD9354992.1 M67 family metallopeptidase [Methylomonas albis]
MNNSEIYLPRKLTNQLLHLAQLSPNAEVCGLIGMDSNGMPVSCYPVENRAPTPENRFLLDASQQIEAMRQIRDRGETLFAIYHSHPHSPALPSPTDIKEANYPDALHLIISLNTKGVLELRGFKIAGQSAEEVVLNLIEA